MISVSTTYEKPCANIRTVAIQIEHSIYFWDEIIVRDFVNMCNLFSL